MYVTIISSRKQREDSSIPRPRMKKAGDMSIKVKDLILVLGGTSVRH